VTTAYTAIKAPPANYAIREVCSKNVVTSLPILFVCSSIREPLLPIMVNLPSRKLAVREETSNINAMNAALAASM